MRIIGCVLDQHDFRLVSLAAFMCVLACLTTCALVARARAATGQARIAWLLAAAAEFGGGVWSLHFVAMLAYMPGVAVDYAPVPTAVSALAAVAGAWCAFSVLLLMPATAFMTVVAAACLAAGVATMHYTGVSAMRFAGAPVLELDGVVYSLVACTVFAVVAVRAMRGLQRAFQFAMATLWLALAVCALHFQGMASLTLRLGGGANDGAGGIGTVAMAAAVGLVSVALLSASLALAVMDWQLSRRTTQERERLRRLLGMSFEGLLIERNGAVVYVNDRLCELTGQGLPSLVGQNLDCLGLGDVFRPSEIGERTTEHRVLHRNGSFIPVECVVRSVDYEGRAARAVAVRDLSERHENEAALARLAHHDSLTGLPNRLLLNDRLASLLIDARPLGRTIAVLCLGLDGFKAVNDVLGHAVGDELLIETARRLERELRDGDLLARLGGDEFVAAVQTASGSPAALAERLVQVLAEPFTFAGQVVVAGMSAGVALFPDHADNGNDLLRCADIAMRCAKDTGRNSFRVFAPDMDRHLQERRTMERDLRQAIDDGSIALHYQPLVNAITGRIEGYEALVRWQHPVLGMVPPSVFIPLAEEKQLIQSLGRWVLETACREAAEWTEPLRVAVNLSPKQFQQVDLTGYIFDLLARSKLPADRLELELTEGVLIDNPDHAQHMLSTLRAGGVRVSLDDFGTGYSSLSYLRRFPLDKIKIDRSFVINMADDPQSAAIVQALIALAHTLGLCVTAEGVETMEQLNELQLCACDQVQGYLLGRPAQQTLSVTAVPVSRSEAPAIA